MTLLLLGIVLSNQSPDPFSPVLNPLISHLGDNGSSAFTDSQVASEEFIFCPHVQAVAFDATHLFFKALNLCPFAHLPVACQVSVAVLPFWSSPGFVFQPVGIEHHFSESKMGGVGLSQFLTNTSVF